MEIFQRRFIAIDIKGPRIAEVGQSQGRQQRGQLEALAAVGGSPIIRVDGEGGTAAGDRIGSGIGAGVGSPWIWRRPKTLYPRGGRSALKATRDRKAGILERSLMI